MSRFVGSWRRTALVALASLGLGGTALAQCGNAVLSQFGGGSVATVAISSTRAVHARGLFIELLDVTNANTPTVVGNATVPAPIRDIARAGDGFLAATDDGVCYFTISGNSVTLTGIYELAGAPDVYGVAVDWPTVYASFENDVHVIDFTNPAAPTQAGVFHGSYGGVGVNEGTLSVEPRYGSDRLVTLDVSDPSNIVQRGSVDLGSFGAGFNSRVRMLGSYAYVMPFNTNVVSIVDTTNADTPVKVGSFSSGGMGGDLSLEYPYLYLAAGTAGLETWNMTAPEFPTKVDTTNTSGFAMDLSVLGARLYLSDREGGFRVYTLTNPATPAAAGTRLLAPGYARDIAITGTTALVADGQAGLRVFNNSNPNSPALIATIDTGGEAQRVVVSGTLALVADGTGGLVIVDVTNVNAPFVRGIYDDLTIDAWDLAASGNIVCVVGSHGARIIDITNPAAPFKRSDIAISDSMFGVVNSGSTFYMAASYQGLKIYNLSNPSSPALLSTTNLFPGMQARAIARSGSTIYLAQNGVNVLNVTNPAAPAWLGNVDQSVVGAIDALAVSGSLLYAGDFEATSVVDVTTPAFPSVRFRLDTDLSTFFSSPFANLRVIGSRLYVCDTTGGIYEYPTSTFLPPYIWGQPQSANVGQHCGTTLSVNASSSSSITYQWYHNNALIQGATLSTYTITDMNSTKAGLYYCAVSNSICGGVLSEKAMVRLCLADVDCNGFINGDDYDVFADFFESGSTDGDLNEDGFLNGDDFDLFASAFEAGC